MLRLAVLSIHKHLPVVYQQLQDVKVHRKTQNILGLLAKVAILQHRFHWGWWILDSWDNFVGIKQRFSVSGTVLQLVQ